MVSLVLNMAVFMGNMSSAPVFSDIDVLGEQCCVQHLWNCLHEGSFLCG